jgi:aryl-alcohol dehydrogenase-like predicted oxidoreductase
MTINRRSFGRTGLTISEISFGCGPTAGLMVHGNAADRRDAVSTALAHGINYFDTAPTYGKSESETQVDNADRGGLPRSLT